MVDRTQTDATPGKPLQQAVDERVASYDAANSARSARTALEQFTAYLQRERAVDTLGQLDYQDCRAFVQHLRQRVRDDDLAASTAHTYYERVRAACGWWVRNGDLQTNVAKDQRVSEELPESGTTRDGASEDHGQTWTQREREVLLNHTTTAVDAAQDAASESGTRLRAHDGVLQAHRDRVFVYLLAFTGVRGAEVLRHPSDDARDGLQWRDWRQDGAVDVLGKSHRDDGGRERQWVSVPGDTQAVLDRWQSLLAPADETWPVLPTLAKGALTQDLAAHGLGDRVDAEASVRDRLDVYAAAEIAPPALSVRAGRRRLDHLSEASGLDRTLTPHGARRRLGDDLYEEQAELAQETLRHQSIETTHQHYRDEEAAERAQTIEDVLDDL